MGDWGWAREVPVSRKTIGGGPSESTQKRRQLSIQQRLLKGYSTLETLMLLPEVVLVEVCSAGC